VKKRKEEGRLWIPARNAAWGESGVLNPLDAGIGEKYNPLNGPAERGRRENDQLIRGSLITNTIKAAQDIKRSRSSQMLEKRPLFL